jgi:uncharacterized protein YndB with AHSA1/START domain
LEALSPKREGASLYIRAPAQHPSVQRQTMARIGGRYVIVERRDLGDVEHTGEYLEIDRPKRLVFTLVVPMFSSDATRISIDIVPVSAGSCDLTLTHEGVYQEYASRTQDGWSKILEGLQSSIDVQV